MKKLTINLIKTTLVLLLIPFFGLFLTLRDVLDIGAGIFDEIINKLKNY